MLIRVGDAVIDRDDVLFASIEGNGNIKVQFKDKTVLRVDTNNPEDDLNKITVIRSLPNLDSHA